MTSWEEKVRRVVPYVAGEQPKDKNIIKLNTNECPYPPARGVQEELRKLAEEYSNMRLYPDMDATPLVEALARKYELDPEQIFVGVGSDDVLALCFLTFFTSGGKILFPGITYSFYDVWADLYRIPYERKPLDDAMNIVPADYIPVNSEDGNDPEIAGIIFPNPNAPTGVELPQDAVEQIVAANPGCVVIVDEAYVDFGAKSALPLIKKYDNLLIVQTFSKSRAMAGARIGFAMGNPKLIKYLKDVKFSFNSYTMNLPSIRLGTAAVEDDAYFREITSKIVATRERTKNALAELGFEFPDSRSNFIFARHPKFEGADLQKKLRERGIVVRHFSAPEIDPYLRITIGTDEQMDAVITAMKEILA